MSKKILGTVLALAFVVPAVTSAASIPGFYEAIFDGQTEVTDVPEATVDVDAFVEVDTGEVLYAISTDVIGDSLPRECHKVSPIQGAQSHQYSLDHKLPPNPEDYGFRIDGYTADNVNQAKALQGIGDGCNGDFDTMYDEGDVVHVVPGSSSGSDVGGDTSELSILISSVSELQNAITALVQAFQTSQTPAKPAVCNGLQSLVSAAMYGTYSTSNTMLQQHLVTNGYAIPALSQGATYGYYGPQTASALTAAQSSCL